jgi:hypothetical protein
VEDADLRTWLRDRGLLLVNLALFVPGRRGRRRLGLPAAADPPESKPVAAPQAKTGT